MGVDKYVGAQVRVIRAYNGDPQSPEIYTRNKLLFFPFNTEAVKDVGHIREGEKKNSVFWGVVFLYAFI